MNEVEKIQSHSAKTKVSTFCTFHKIQFLVTNKLFEKSVHSVYCFFDMQ